MECIRIIRATISLSLIKMGKNRKWPKVKKFKTRKSLKVTMSQPKGLRVLKNCSIEAALNHMTKYSKEYLS